MDKKKGVITIATGDEWYYEIAVNLLRSYRLCSESPFPFAILTDSENHYTREFDDVLISPETSGSYMDKLLLGQNLPHEETIFIDADCLAYGDLNELFEVFSVADDFSCLGNVPQISDVRGVVSV